MRCVGLDVHRDFCEVAIVEHGVVRSAGRVPTTPEALTLFAQSLGPDAQVVLEATGNALAIARVLRPHVARVVLTDPSAVHESGAAKTDRIDARALARLLASGFVREVWAPDDETAMLRWQLSRRRQLVKHRTREKNQVHAVLIRNLKERPPMSDLFGVNGRAWLAGAGSARNRARDRAGLPAPPRLPRGRDPGAGPGDRPARAGIRGDAAAAAAARRERDHRGDVDGRDRRHRALRDATRTWSAISG